MALQVEPEKGIPKCQMLSAHFIDEEIEASRSGGLLEFVQLVCKNDRIQIWDS